jgi:hypothetical protein
MKFTTLAILLLASSMIVARRLGDVANEAIDKKVENPETADVTKKVLKETLKKNNSEGFFSKIKNGAEEIVNTVAQKASKITGGLKKSFEGAKNDIAKKLSTIKDVVTSHIPHKTKEEKVQKATGQIAEKVKKLEDKAKETKPIEEEEVDEQETKTMHEPKEVKERRRRKRRSYN